MFLSLVLLFAQPTQSAPASSSLRTILLGDWGGDDNAPKYTTKAQLSTADAMDFYATSNPIDSVVAVGDNFYEHGVDDVTSARFLYTFEAVYSSRSLMVPWYLLAGNHD
jgi:tartrate-resistant acid phosphatase type 5